MAQMYQLTAMLRAVYLDGEKIGGIREIPEGAVLTVIGDAPVPGLTEVVYEGDRYALFYDDLVYRAKKTWAVAVGA